MSHTNVPFSARRRESITGPSLHGWASYQASEHLVLLLHCEAQLQSYLVPHYGLGSQALSLG